MFLTICPKGTKNFPEKQKEKILRRVYSLRPRSPPMIRVRAPRSVTSLLRSSLAPSRQGRGRNHAGPSEFYVKSDAPVSLCGWHTLAPLPRTCLTYQAPSVGDRGHAFLLFFFLFPRASAGQGFKGKKSPARFGHRMLYSFLRRKKCPNF